MESSRVTLADLDVPFWSMVWFMVKWAVASIPAMFILGVAIAAITAGMGLILAMLGIAADGLVQ